MNREQLYEVVTYLHSQGYGSRRIQKMIGINRKVFEHWIYREEQCKPRKEPDLTPSPELSYLIGSRLGDGCVTQSGRHYTITLMAKDKEFVERFRSCLEKVSRRKVYFFRAKKRYWQALAYSKPLFLFLKSKNVVGYGEIIKLFPADFIQGIADSEGCVYVKGKKHRYIIIVIDNTSLSLLEYVQQLLLSKFRIESLIRRSTRSGWQKRDCYRLSVQKQLAVKRFTECIGFTISRKAKKLNGLPKKVVEIV